MRDIRLPYDLKFLFPILMSSNTRASTVGLSLSLNLSPPHSVPVHPTTYLDRSSFPYLVASESTSVSLFDTLCTVGSSFSTIVRNKWSSLVPAGTSVKGYISGEGENLKDRRPESSSQSLAAPFSSHSSYISPRPIELCSPRRLRVLSFRISFLVPSPVSVPLFLRSLGIVEFLASTGGHDCWRIDLGAGKQRSWKQSSIGGKKAGQYKENETPSLRSEVWNACSCGRDLDEATFNGPWGSPSSDLQVFKPPKLLHPGKV